MNVPWKYSNNNHFLVHCTTFLLLFHLIYESQSTAELVAAEIAAISSSADMSSRQKNVAKRRAKILAKQRSKENCSPVPGSLSK